MRDRYGSGLRLKEARNNLGLTQAELGKELGLKATYLSVIETNQQPVSEPIAMKLYELYRIDPEWLLYGKAPRGASSSRLRQVRSHLGLTQAAMAKDLQVSAQYIGRMEKGDLAISEPVAQKIERKYSIPAKWLLYGEGSSGLDASVL